MHDLLKIVASLKLTAIACIMIVSFLAFSNCTKHQPHEPPEQVPPDTVIIHEHHDHEIVVTDTVFQFMICDSIDLIIEFIGIGDQSAPNIYPIYLNDVLYVSLITEVFPQITEVKFLIEFFGIVFGDVIAIRDIKGSRAAIVGSAIVGIKCSE